LGDLGMVRVSRRVTISAAVGLFLVAIQCAAWQIVARRSLQAQLPAMLRYGLLNYERRMEPYSVWPRHVHVVLEEALPDTLASRSADFQKAYAPAKVKVSTERTARAAGYLSGWRCRECTVVQYKEERNNPLFARVAVSLGGGDHAVGYDHLYVHIFGSWLHVRTRFLWIT
jgi:hypothetical protein